MKLCAKHNIAHLHKQPVRKQNQKLPDQSIQTFITNSVFKNLSKTDLQSFLCIHVKVTDWVVGYEPMLQWSFSLRQIKVLVYTNSPGGSIYTEGRRMMQVNAVPVDTKWKSSWILLSL